MPPPAIGAETRPPSREAHDIVAFEPEVILSTDAGPSSAALSPKQPEPPLTQSAVVLKTEGLTKSFQGFVAVQDVDFALRRGHIHAVIGPNGAGKTTFFNLLTKFLTPTRGRIFYQDEDITGLKPAQIARRGVVRSFQISAIFPHLTVMENVRVALQRKLGTIYQF